MSKKERLNLTVRDDFRAKAESLANKRRRSISGLFEDLIEAESLRVKESPHTATHKGEKPKSAKRVTYSKSKKRAKVSSNK